MKKFALQAALLAALITLCGTALMSGTAQSVKEERKVEDKIPAHLPIKVKVKNPDKALDLKNEKWLGDLEIEVTNRGSKPMGLMKLSTL
jgi:predicted membrane protein